MIRILITILCTSLFTLSANAVNWFDLGQSSDKQVQTFIDNDSIKPYKINTYTNDNHVSAFVQSTYINNNKLRKTGLYYTKYFMVADCNKRSLGSTAYISYGFKDEVIDSYQDKYFTASKMNIVFPETVGESILEYMCDSEITRAIKILKKKGEQIDALSRNSYDQ